MTLTHCGPAVSRIRHTTSPGSIKDIRHMKREAHESIGGG
jgi:hypothetical protein